MKKKALVSALLCLSLLSSGCIAKPKTPSSETRVSSNAAVTTEASTTDTENSPAVTRQHEVKIIDLDKSTYTDESNETYTSVYPKLIVDGKEATEINERLKSYILKTYPIKVKTEYGYIEGYETSYRWGVNCNIVSINIHVSGICSDYFTNEVFNYDLDTLKPVDDSEVIKRFGMTGEEFISKTKEILKKNCEGKQDFDLDKTLAAANFDNISPFITPDGQLGVLTGFVFAEDSQFGGMESVRGFDIMTMGRIY